MPYHTRDTLVWGSYDGRETLVKDLDVRHLVNILNHVADSNAEAMEEGVSEAYSEQTCRILEAEAGIRIMAGWADDTGIPRFVDDCWVLVNQTAEEKAIEDAKTALHQAAMAKQLSKNQRLSPVELIRQSYKIQQLKTPEIAK